MSAALEPEVEVTAVVDEAVDQAVGSLSPSRAGDFLTCPLLFRFRTIDRLPERPSVDAARGTLVHKVLEDLFDLPAAERTPEAASGLLEPSWTALVDAEPALAELFADDPDGGAIAAWLASCRQALARYFTLEDPRRLEPAERELYLESMTDTRLLLRGIVDRVDIAPDGSVRIVDYKTGRSPREGGEARALFQLKFYGLLLWRIRGVLPRRLQLIYLGDGQILSYDPDEQDLLACERKVEALWRAIQTATASGDFQPRPSALCRWCDHQALCPVYGGTPPPYPPVQSPVVDAAEEPADPSAG